MFSPRVQQHEVSKDSTGSPVTKAAMLELEIDSKESHSLDSAHRQTCVLEMLILKWSKGLAFQLWCYKYPFAH